MNAKQKRENKALNELRGTHSYLMYELRQKAERQTMIFSRLGKRSDLRPAVAIKLVVPEDSVLGREIVAMRKLTAREDKKRKPNARAKAGQP